jgi:hypothetical protein
MSSFQMMSTSVSDVNVSSVYGPLFSPSRNPCRSPLINSARLFT